jgi:hypothetical protein
MPLSITDTRVIANAFDASCSRSATAAFNDGSPLRARPAIAARYWRSSNSSGGVVGLAAAFDGDES